MNRLQNCIEELVKFILLSHINQTLDFDLGLSLEFCSGLLKPETNDDAISRSAGVDFDYGSFEGVPQYPLCKRLASALHCSVNQRAFCKTCEVVGLINEDDLSKQREKEWSGLLLVNLSHFILEAVDFELHVQEHFFSLIKDRVKTVEGRCAVGDYNRDVGSRVLRKSFLESEPLKKSLSSSTHSTFNLCKLRCGGVIPHLSPDPSSLPSFSFLSPKSPIANCRHRPQDSVANSLHRGEGFRPFPDQLKSSEQNLPSRRLHDGMACLHDGFTTEWHVFTTASRRLFHPCLLRSRRSWFPSITSSPELVSSDHFVARAGIHFRWWLPQQ
ncbi:hypothetical protein Ddye_023669 [Dipteronia dyeriana]|uniref:Uncharacterized protein n=1 Tax=Dipteronia dyeriana TaxID=168575 RepID=A0AAD9TTH4_9ROSI|nr:hypothetical protein Ddye_023669 [Dipteronia dyeriana]